MTLKDDTEPYWPEQLTLQASMPPVVLQLSVEGLGGISEYAVRIELPAFEDHIRAVANIVSQVNEMVFTMNGTELEAQS
jgi:hypothetical protein